MKLILLALMLLSGAVFSQETNLSVISTDRITNNGINFNPNNVVKTVYRGLSNPLHIAVNNAKSFRAKAQGLKKVKDNFYYFNVTSIPQDTTSIEINIKLLNGKHKIERQHFVVKDIPWFTAIIGNKIHSGNLTGYTKYALMNAKFSGYFFIEHLSCQALIGSLDIDWGDGTRSYIEGDTLNNEAKQRLLNLPIGSVITVQMMVKTSQTYCGPLGETYKILILSEEVYMSYNDMYMYPRILPENDKLVKNKVNKLKIIPPYNTRLSVSANGITKIDSLNYELDTRATTNSYSDINFVLTTQEDSTYNYTKRIYFKDKDDVVSTINGKGCSDCIVKLKNSELTGAHVEVLNNNLIDEEKWLTVYGFTIEVGKRSYKIKGNIITKEIADEILKKDKNKSILITNIHYHAVDQFPQPTKANKIEIVLVE